MNTKTCSVQTRPPPGPFCQKTGHLLQGEIFSQVDLAATISAVAERGADAFYKGEIAASIARSTQRAGGYLSEEDLAAHESTFVEPISTDYRGIQVYEIPPPGQGVAALEMLNILEGFDLSSMEPSSADRIHLEVEAKSSPSRTCTRGSGILHIPSYRPRSALQS